MAEALEAKKDKSPDEWEINNWADTIIRAEEIKADEKKMKLVAPILQKKKAALDNLPIKNMEQLKAKANNMSDEESDSEDSAEDGEE